VDTWCSYFGSAVLVFPSCNHTFAFLKIQDDPLEELPDSWPSGRCFAAWGKCGFTFQAIQVVEVDC